VCGEESIGTLAGIGGPGCSLAPLGTGWIRRISSAQAHPFCPQLPHPNPHGSQVPATGQDALYITGKVSDGPQLLLELRFHRGTLGVDASFKAERADLAGLTFDAIAKALA